MTKYFPEDKWVTVNGLRLHYLDYGGDRTKTPLILQHGLGGNAHVWDDFAPHFADTHHVVALDARGCGDSDWSRDGYSVQSQAHDIGQFALATGLYQFDYYGHSQGSRAGMPLGAYYGHLIKHLVLGDYGPMPDPSPAGRANAQARQSNMGERPKGFFVPEKAFEWHKQAEPELSDEAVWKKVRTLYRSNWDGILVPKTDPEILWLNGRAALKEGEFLWDSVGKISCKTLILRGENTAVLDLPQAEKMEATIPNGNGRLYTLPNAAHGLHTENEEGTLAILREFFAS